MPYSAADHFSQTQLEALKKLLSCQQVRVLTHQGGGNSKVYCVEADGMPWAVKSYPLYAPNQRDRLAAELMTYQFLNQQNVPCVPRLKTASETERWLVMSWIEGVVPTKFLESDVDQAIQFLRVIASLNTLAAAKQLPQAAEACLSLTILINQVKRRLQRLLDVSPQEPELRHFLLNVFLPVFARCQQQAEDGYAEHAMDPDAELPQAKRSLIPADFGFHNSIRQDDGTLYFFDFDYFGWDDPVKLLADILWHPKMKLSDAQKNYFIAGLQAIYKSDPQFVLRFNFTKALFGLRWVLILLNEFIPEYWQNRQHANAAQDQAAAKALQLMRANELLLNVKKGFTHGYADTTSL
jgi:hypothetical protein